MFIYKEIINSLWSLFYEIVFYNFVISKINNNKNSNNNDNDSLEVFLKNYFERKILLKKLRNFFKHLAETEFLLTMSKISC